MSSNEDPYVVLNWNADSETGFAPAFGCELLWLWTKADKDQFPSCPIKGNGNVRLVLLTWNDKCEEDESNNVSVWHGSGCGAAHPSRSDYNAQQAGEVHQQSYEGTAY